MMTWVINKRKTLVLFLLLLAGRRKCGIEMYPRISISSLLFLILGSNDIHQSLLRSHHEHRNALIMPFHVYNPFLFPARIAIRIKCSFTFSKMSPHPDNIVWIS